MLCWDETSVSPSSKPTVCEGFGQPHVSKELRTSGRVGVNTQGQQPKWTLAPAGVWVPFFSRECMGVGQADSQVEKTAFSGVGRNVGKLFPLP